MNAPIILPIEKMKEEPYANVLCYPRANETEVQTRIEELRKHGVKKLEFAGGTSVFNVPVLGKGFVGIAVIAHLNGQRVALKIRRVDADRLGLQHEASMLTKANTVNVGPKLISATTNFLLMQLIDGDLLPKWLELHKKKEPARTVLMDILEQCWRLDATGLDHGELSKAPKHVIIDAKQQPFIIDFETASINRKTANVTAICQYIFAGNSSVAHMAAETLGENNHDAIVEALRTYKHNKNRENFEHLLQICFSEKK
ncbi:MAG: serine/threonine protein kinase [Candidatus Bathyarchaeota archaeon]|nr:serine/threonine protein kinase [Candidatus Bathyarchaeota archaeon]